MSILNSLKNAHAAILFDQKKALGPNPNGAGGLSARINSMAVEALTNGIDSDAWIEYMSLFANNKAELAQLSNPAQTEGGENAWLKQMRAYIVSNAICDIGTNGDLAANVTEDINIVQDDIDADFIATRKFQIPKVG